MFQLLDEPPLKELIESEDMQKPIWEYSGKYYLAINAVKVKETCFNKDHPYIMVLTFSKYGFEKKGEQITIYSISEINKNY